MVSGDRLRLSLILRNLTDNAIKYSAADAPITVSVRAGSTTATVAVADRGVGIPPEDLPRLFQRFSRLTGDEAGGPGGLGLGLYLSRQLALLQGGDLTVKSVMGEGSTFELTLPLGGS